ncbi:glutathione synthetase ATP-binding domain-like protein [Aspergillus terreus]|uniref:Glutathione synthetase ATP-binding domain-like protein n=1 Tax=Aspergillus terreus TaxID=33178 RepID=A0A5M3Z1V3_ASPTE|nr:hypothetical protein ATETN484_0007023000 [Aspergillus terreus]GFF16035.1 glutathione synthetase ATP-binding domain-like protein [Aspergillus terreus]
MFPEAARTRIAQCSRNIPRALETRCYSTSSKQYPTVAVLFQDIDPPVINGVRKPRKPGGYQDSGADIAYNLRAKGVTVITPEAHPSDRDHEGWCFPDTAEGIQRAVQKGATHLWANTILFNSHPLQASDTLNALAARLYVVGQPPGLVENFDDKAYLNGKLGQMGGFTLPLSWIITSSDDVDSVIRSIDQYPVVGKPIRGRGSHGVKVCHSATDLQQHLEALFRESPTVMVEEFLSGEEATVTVMPPSPDRPEYWSMPPVVRFNHADGIAPYNGVVAVTANSRTVSPVEMGDASFTELLRQCARVAEVIGATAPIRVDARRFEPGSRFALFDINMKPNMTGPGRPGREDQASLTALSAAAIGWDYPTLLQRILQCAQPLGVFRNYQSPF